MDNMRFDPQRFSPEELPNLEQLQREQSFAARSDAEFPPDYARQDYRRPYQPQQGYATGYPYAQQPSYAPGYPYAQGYQQPEMPRGYEMPMQQPYVPQHAAYPQQQAAYAPPYGADPRAFGPIPSYDDLARQQMPQNYYPDESGYRPQHMREPQPYAEEQPRYAAEPQRFGAEPQRYAEEPRNEDYLRDFFSGKQPEKPKAEPAAQYRDAANSLESLPSLSELHRALQAERQAEAQRAMEAQRAAMEAQQREQRERAAMQQRQMQQMQQPSRPAREPNHTPEYPASQSPKRFVIEDLEPDGDEDSHTKKKHFLQTEEKSQFASLLKRFRPKNS